MCPPVEEIQVHPLAADLNQTLKDQAPEVFEMLSAYGRRIYFPKGILSQSAEAAFSCLHPLAWLGLLATVTAWGLTGRRDKTAWTIIGPLAFLLAPLSSLASPKYALPALVFVPLAFAWGLARCRLPLTPRLLSIATAIILAIHVIPLDLRIRPPFVVWNTGPNTSIYTHDGPRSTSGYALAYEYEDNDCVFIDNLAVAHRAAPNAHLSADEQGLRILHRSTVRGVQNLMPDFGLPKQLNIFGPSPLGDGVWQAGGLGFRWDDALPMQN